MGTLAAAHRCASPTASARSSARRPGAIFLGPNVSVLQAASRDVASTFAARATKSSTRRCSFRRVTYVWHEWERYGAVNRVVPIRRRPHDPHRAHHRGDHRENGASPCISHAYYVSGALADVRAIQAALPPRRHAALRGCLSNDRSLSVRRARVGSRHRYRRLAQVAAAADPAAAGST